MLIIDMVVILCIKRYQSIDSQLNSNALKTLLGTMTDEENQFLVLWNHHLHSVHLENLILSYYKDYESDDIVKYLEYKYNHHFPILFTYIKNNVRKQYVILYYFYRGYHIERYDKIFNIEQNRTINLNEGIVVVNAGCGTGKTTTACKKAFECRNEGVIFISYTNSAVNEDKKRMYDYPLTSSLMSTKGFSNHYVFGTIDKIAGIINKGISETYDHSIKAACIKLEAGLQLQQKHIIVDEAQDIDDLRADFIYTLFFFGGCKSLTIFGDPRQKVSEKGGKWYKNLWIHADNNISFSYKNITRSLERIGFTISYRFKNNNILQLVNSLSVRRPEIDCQLTVLDHKIEDESIPISVFNCTPETETEIMTNICNFIQNKHFIDKVPYSEFIVVGPSLEADNQTSLLARKITSFFRNCSIPCKLFSEGNYEPDGILFSTIQSVKGLEADYVFLFGLNNYPHSFSMIPYEEAESLIFVAHSRARKQIFYINNINQMILPRGIKEEYVFTEYQGYSFQPQEKEEEYKNVCGKSVTSLLKCFDFKKLSETNELTTSASLLDIKFPTLIDSQLPPDFFGILIGMGVQMYSEQALPESYRRFISDNYNLVNNSIYNQIKRKDNFENGKDENGVIYLRESEDILTIKEKLSTLNTNLSTMVNKDYYLLTTLLIYISTGIIEEYPIEEDFDLHVYFCEVASIINIHFGKTLGSEVRVNEDNICGSIDILTECCVIELKTKKTIKDIDYLQPLLYKALASYPKTKTINCQNKMTILINLRLNQTYIVNSNRIIDYWVYFIGKYNQIREQINFNRYRSRKERVMIEFPNNSFCVDTEFDPMNDNEIFEIGIFNINDPYRSIIQIVKPSNYTLPFAMEWLQLSEELFKTSPTIEKIKSMFNRITFLFDQKPTLYYYICPVDYSWSDLNLIDLINVGKLTKQIAVRKGTFKGNVTAPKLIDFYNSHIEFISQQPYLSHHTALSDCLMLYSILKLQNCI